MSQWCLKDFLEIVSGMSSWLILDYWDSIHLMTFLESKIIRLIINILFIPLWMYLFISLRLNGFYLPQINPANLLDKSDFIQIIALIYTSVSHTLFLGVYILPIYYFTKFIWFKESRQIYKRNFKRIKKFLIKMVTNWE